MKRFALILMLAGFVAVALAFFLRYRTSPLGSQPLTDNKGSPQSISLLSTPQRTNESRITNPLTTAVRATDVKEPSDADIIVSQSNANLIAFFAFSDWARRFVAGDPFANPARGAALAWKRREALLELIQNNPEQALKMAVPFAWRRALPASVSRFFEEQVDGRGSLEVFVATDFERGLSTTIREATLGGKSYRTFAYGRRLKQVSQPEIPLHGIALDGKLALHSDPIRMLEPAEIEARLQDAGPQTSDPVCGVSGQPADWRNQSVAADIGGEFRHFCGVDHLQLVNQRWAATESDTMRFNGPFAAGFGTWSHGAKTLLYMRLNFPDDLTEPISEARAYEVMNGANNFYTEGSYDLTSLTTTVTPLLTLPQTKAWYSTTGPGGLLTDARAAARRAGFDTVNYNLDIVAFTTVPGYDFGGLAAVHGKGNWLQSTGVGVTCHELGHNYGLWHANFWDTTNTFSVIGSGTNTEYGNIYDTMGSAGAGPQHFNSQFKNTLGWLPDSAVHNVVSNGVYRIYPFDSPNRVDGRFYAAKISKDFRRDYWIEFRQRFMSNPWLQNGVLLNWSPWDDSSGGTHLLDTTPGTLTGANSREDAAVTIGRTFTDPGAGVHITPLARGATGTNAWIDVQVNSGFPANQAPRLQVEIDPTNAASGALVHFHATASDPDGDSLAYAWTFEDLSFSTNNQPWTFKSWSAQGDHVVRCVASDMKGGVASANALVTVGSRTRFRISGHVLDANGDPIEGVRVDNGETNLSTYLGGYTDSQGAYLIVGVTSDLTLQAVKYGFSFANINWQNPLTVTNDVINADFLATPFPNVNIIASTNALPENSSSNQYFTLSRTGDLTTNLMVNLYLSGSARVASDFTLSPGLATGTNTVEFPSNVASLTFSFRTVNDSTIEGLETATVTIIEDPFYVIAPSGAASITIIDDDQSNLPAVTLSAAAPSIPETGTDHGQFIFTRTGSTQNDLPVFYAATGTATAGTDYSTLLGVIIIPAGQSSAILDLRPLDDKNLEPDETVIVTVSANAAYTGAGSRATITVLDDDLMTVTIFPTDAGAAEPSTPGRFTVKRDGDFSDNLLVNYFVTGTATAGSDYIALPGSVIIPAGSASADIVLTARDDTLLEGDESIIVTLATNIGYNIGFPGSSATLTIRDNEKVSVSISATDLTASEPGDNMGRFQISRGSVVNGALTVNLAISGTAIAGADYIPLDSTVVIPNGSSSVTLDIIVFDDLHMEPTEDVIVSILPSTNYNIGSSQAKVTIEDDDGNNPPAAGFSFTTSSAEESRSPGISVSLSATSASPVTVNYRIIGGTASNNDYSLPAGPLTFAPGERAKPIPLQIVNDTTVEPNETIRIAVYDPIGATLDGIKIHTYTILDDDTSSVTVAATAPTASETSSTPGNFRISRTGSTAADLTVNFQITGTASSPGDYASVGNSVVIPSGAAFVDLPVVPVNDDTVEYDETVVITLTSASAGARILSPNSDVVTIADNDPNALPVVTITSTNRPNAVEGGASGEFVFTRGGSPFGELTVYFSIGGTATTADYSALPASIVIPDGETSATLPVNAIDDASVEPEETVIASVTLRDTYRVGYSGSAIVTIQDNDQNVRLDAADFLAAEPGADRGEFIFTRFGTTNSDLRVFFTITGNAINGTDYATLSNSFTIPAGSLTATLPIIPLDDGLVEGPEKVTLTLQGNPGYVLSQPSTATVTIWDDEPMLTLSAPMTNIVEGAKPPGVFRITRTGDPKYNFTARLAAGGSALYGVDYPPFLTNVYFSCGVTAIDLVISPTNELLVESSENVTARLLPDPAYTILSPSNAFLNILDAGTNLTPVVTITSPTTDTVFLLGTNVGIILEAAISDDSDTNSPLNILWSKITGPDSYILGNTNQSTNTVIFTNAGVYVLRLTVDDNMLTNFAEVTAVVGAVELFSTNRLHWALDESSGINVPDTSGTGRDGMVVGNSDWTTNGVLGGALRLFGDEDHVRQTAGTNTLEGLKAFSLSLWIKPANGIANQGIFTANDSGTNLTLSLATRTVGSCGGATNVVEATMMTTGGSVRHVSASNMASNAWQHVAITWSNGLAPALFVNGQFDQPLHHMVALGGFLTNCPQFLVGQAFSPAIANWNGWLDDVRVFPRALSAKEVGALASLPPTNYGAVVDVGPDVTVQLIYPFELAGTVTDDGKPIPPGALINTWLVISNPAPVIITNANSLTNTIQFTSAGQYVFRLIGDDGQVKVFHDLTVTVIEPTRVDVNANKPEAAELGPQTGEFTFTRNGDINFDLAVLLAMSGTASNGVDFLPLTNVVTFPAGTDSVVWVVSPFLDHPIEGDETFTLTIVSNLAYTIGNGTATVTIHDSPYGQWSVAHFTLEELTDPTISGEAADFDHDGLVNFSEYAANRDPKARETNGPIQTSIEFNPADGTNHVTLTYPRRLQPTDTAYAVYVSTDLVTWNTGTNYVEELQATDDGNMLTETVKARLKAPYPGSTPQFVTVRVWLLTTGP